MAAAKKHAMELSRDRGMPYINGYDHPQIMAGQGTIGLEIVEQCGDVDAVIVPGIININIHYISPLSL